jgi:Protein of unknown function (DUF3823) N-terminal domain/Domain of unknown function (DUF3823_C)
MKKAYFFNTLLFALVLSAASCEKDNMPGPDAQVFGIIKDKTTGLPVETDLVNGSAIEAFELGYATPVSQRWVIKNNGEYRNNLVFSNKYNFELRNSNFFPISVPNQTIKPGENKLDFEVDPYIRVKNCNISYDAAAKKINASFSLEAGQTIVKLKAVRLYAFSDIYVGEPTKFATTGSGFSQSYTPSKIIDNATITLSIDLAANAGFFPTGRDYFFRVGALADVTGVGTIRHNYAPNVKISL